MLKARFFNQFYLPDRAATAQILGDVVEGATLRWGAGGGVGVVCGATAYAGNGSGKESAGAAIGGVRVERLGSFKFGHGHLRKLLSYAGYYGGSILEAAAGEKAEVIVTMTTPPLLALVGWMAQSFRGSRHVIWEMDVYPDVAVGLGTFRKGGLLDRFTGWLADTARRKADGVIVLGHCMARIMERRGVPRDKIWICENWADGAVIRPVPFHGGSELRVLYSGNLGLAHDIETFAGAARELGDGYRVRFCGGGPRMGEMRNRLAGLDWITFEGYEERGNLMQRLGWADVGLVTQRAETIGMVVPSKAYGIMAAGRGVLYVGPAESEIGQMVEREGAGWRVANGDSGSLAALLARLRRHRHEVEQAGKRARELFERRYSTQEGVGRVLGAIERCIH